MMGGQYLDLIAAQRGAVDEAAVHRVLIYKSGKYTVERPLHMGAVMGEATGQRLEAVRAAYSAYGVPLGEAFQLRDDVLGVYGSPEVTGKPAGDDLREGKETYLVLRTRERSGPAGRRLLESSLGDAKLSDDAVQVLRGLIADCGALAETEARIAALVDRARAAVDDRSVAPQARAALDELAVIVTDRNA
jgi:geranylgeranyl diphosphate synthase type I